MLKDLDRFQRNLGGRIDRAWRCLDKGKTKISAQVLDALIRGSDLCK
jgi:hypothetical protein